MKRSVSLFFALIFVFIASAPISLAYTVPPDTIVYVTPTGDKYHREGCTHIKGSATAMTIQDAIDAKKGACSRCNPDVLTGPYVSSGKSSGSSGKSDGSTSPNHPDKYEPPSEPEPDVRFAEALQPASKEKSLHWWEWLFFVVISISVLYFGLILLLGIFTVLRDFLAGLFHPKNNSQSEKDLKRMEYENTKKIERLQELLSKGYCKNPYTDQPMVSIDDFIEYVEKLNRDVEAQQKRQRQ